MKECSAPRPGHPEDAHPGPVRSALSPDRWSEREADARKEHAERVFAADRARRIKERMDAARDRMTLDYERRQALHHTQEEEARESQRRAAANPAATPLHLAMSERATSVAGSGRGTMTASVRATMPERAPSVKAQKTATPQLSLIHI